MRQASHFFKCISKIGKAEIEICRNGIILFSIASLIFNSQDIAINRFHDN